MSDILFVTLYLLVPVVGYWLLKAARIEPLQVSIPSIFFIYYLMVAYIGIVAIYYNWTWYEYIDPNDSIGILRVCFYSASTLLMTTFGFWLASRLKGSREASRWAPSQPASRSIYLPLILMIGVSVVALVLYLKNFSSSALTASLEGDNSIESKLIRSQMTNDFQGVGKFHYYSFFFESLLPFCTFVILGQFFLKRSFWLWILTLASLGTALYASLITAEKGLAVGFILGCIITYVHLKKGRIRARNILIFFILASLMIFVMVTFFVGLEGRTTADLTAWLFSRIFSGSIIPSYVYLDYFPHHEPFLWGRSLPNPRGIFPWESYNLTIEMAKVLHDNVITETVGSAPTAYWGELYANFGPFGPVLIAPLVGFYIYAIHLLTNKLRPSPIKSALVCWCALHFMNLAVTGINSYVLDNNLILILMAATVLLLADGQIRLSWRSQRSYV
jgi:oligosaccharide repeat unit polymerase